MASHPEDEPTTKAPGVGSCSSRRDSVIDEGLLLGVGFVSVAGNAL